MAADNNTIAIETDKRILIGIIADAETTVGFLLAGVGEAKAHKLQNRNFLIVDKSTANYELEVFFANLYNRKNIGVILVAADIMPRLLTVIARYKKTIPIILPIPTRNTLVMSKKMINLKPIKKV